MAKYYSKEKIQEFVDKFGDNSNDTGNTKVQIALATYRINELTQHLNKNRKDASCRRALLSLVGKRRRMLAYLMKTDINVYRSILKELNIRK